MIWILGDIEHIKAVQWVSVIKVVCHIRYIHLRSCWWYECKLNEISAQDLEIAQPRKAVVSKSLFIGLRVFRGTLAAKRSLSAPKKGDSSTNNYPSLIQDPWYSLVPAPYILLIVIEHWTLVYTTNSPLHWLLCTPRLCCCWCDLAIHSDCLTIFCCLYLYGILSPW